jgi:hypothetical protein
MRNLLPEDLRGQLLANNEQMEKGERALSFQPVVKFFTPDAAATWVVVSAEEWGSDLRLFGWCDLGLGFPEFGYVLLSELEQLRGAWGLPVERDIWFTTDLSLEDWAMAQERLAR